MLYCMARPRTPKALKLRTGVKPYRIHDEIEGKGDIGHAPASFSAEERRLWYEVIAQSPLPLSAGERHILERYCKAMIRVRRLEAQIQKSGFTRYDSKRQVEVKSPLLSPLNAAHKELERTGRQLGLGLLNRSSISLRPQHRPGPYVPEDFDEDAFILCLLAEGDGWLVDDERHSMHGLYYSDSTWQPPPGLSPLGVRRERVEVHKRSNASNRQLQ